MSKRECESVFAKKKKKHSNSKTNKQSPLPKETAFFPVDSFPRVVQYSPTQGIQPLRFHPFLFLGRFG